MLYLHSNMDRFESLLFCDIDKREKRNLHSNMDRFESYCATVKHSKEMDLHSNMDRFERHTRYMTGEQKI